MLNIIKLELRTIVLALLINILEAIMEFNDDNHGNLLHQGQLAKQFW